MACGVEGVSLGFCGCGRGGGYWNEKSRSVSVVLVGMLVFVRLWNVWRVGERAEGSVMTAERVKAQRWMMMREVASVNRGIVENSFRL